MPAGKQGPDYQNVQRNLALELVRVTEAAALAGGKWYGKGDKNAADQVKQYAYEPQLSFPIIASVLSWKIEQCTSNSNGLGVVRTGCCGYDAEGPEHSKHGWCNRHWRRRKR